MKTTTLRLVTLLLGLFVGLALILRAQFAPRRAGSGCMAECPSAPAGCERSGVDPGACADKACAAPLPVCHYAPTDAGSVCPLTLAGRCIPP